MRSMGRSLAVGALIGLLLGWMSPALLGPPISAYGAALRDAPRLSDSVTGAGSLLTTWAEAPAIYVNAHLTRTLLSDATLAAIGWTLIGTVAGGLIAARRTRGHTLMSGALGGLALGWMLPAISRALGECFLHCWMHEGPLGAIALGGGAALRAVGAIAEAPWLVAAMVTGAATAPSPPVAMLVSAVAWAGVGIAVAMACAALRGAAPEREATGSSDAAPQGADRP